MRTLVLGGTAMLSYAVAQAAVRAGHEVVCLARGYSGEPPPGVRWVRGDRTAPGAFDELTGEFDAVVDVSRRPSEVSSALAALAGRAGHWTFVSTCNVYADDATPGQRADTAPLVEPAPSDVDETDPANYGACKRACELAVVEAMGADRAFLCRAGLIVGRGDPTVRFGYWPSRLARGGEVLAPGDPGRPVQVVDVRDLADWIVRAGRTGLAGAYDGSCAPVPMAHLLDRVAAGVRVEPELTWVDQEFLVARRVNPWMGARAIPLWLPLPEYAGFLTRDVTRSLDAGLVTRDLADTAADSLAYERTVERAPDAALTAEEERELLAAWHARA